MLEDKIIVAHFEKIIGDVPKTDSNTLLPIISIIAMIFGVILIVYYKKANN